MSILLLVRNFVPAHDQARSGQWNVADIARNTFDLEDKVVGTVGCGRIGYRVLQRLQPFGCKELLWYDYTDLPEGTSIITGWYNANGQRPRRVSLLDESRASKRWSLSVMSLLSLAPSSQRPISLLMTERPIARRHKGSLQQGAHFQDEERILASQHCSRSNLYQAGRCRRPRVRSLERLRR
jgi:hypothetical protein